MKLDLNKFYNSNYKDFVHKEAVEEALRMVAEVDLKDVEIDTILSITFSVDEFDENPIYVEYLDKESKKHIVRIRPAVTNEIQELLKRYVTLEQYETDKQDIYDNFWHIHVPMDIRSQKALDEEGNQFVTLNNDNSAISFQLDPENDGAIQWLCIHNKDGSLGPQYQYMARFDDYAKVDDVPSNAEFLEKIQQLEELIQRKSQETLQSSKEYADTQDNVLRTEITTNVTNQINETKNNILSYVDVKVDELKEYVDNRDAEYHELAKQYADNVKQEAVNSSKTYTDTKSAETLETSKTYTDTKHTEVTQQVTGLADDITPLTSKLSNIWDGHKAPFIYWLPNNDINTMKLENKENDVKVTLNDGDVVYWRKNAYQPTDLSEYATKRYAEDQNKVYGWNTNKNQLLKCIGSFTVDHDGSSISRLTYKQTPDISVGAKVDFTNFATKDDIPVVPNVSVDNIITPTKITYRRDTNAVEVFNGDTGLLNGAFITPEQSNNITNNTTNINNLTQLVQELATKVGNSEIGERTPINFNLTNTSIGGTTDPTITSNDSWYVKIGNSYIISVYITFTVSVTPTTSQKMVTCGMEHDMPGYNTPDLTLTSTVKGKNNNYSNTVKVPTNQNFLQFYIPSIPATDTYNSMEIAIYGSAITKQLKKESE